MAVVRSRSVVTDVETEVDAIIEILGDTAGNIFYVSILGSDTNNGLTWATAFRTIIYAISQCTTGNGDLILVSNGTYNETANGLSGVICNITDLTIRGIGYVLVTNTTNATGNVFRITANNVILDNLSIMKGETSNDNSVLVLVTGAMSNVELINCIVIVDNNATFTGIHVTGGASGFSIKGALPQHSAVYGINDVGVGIYLDNCLNCGTWNTILGSLTTGIHFGSDCSNALFDFRSTIVNCETGLLLSSGAEENILYGTVGNCTTIITDNSGNATNDFASSITHIHEAIEHIPQFTGEIYFVDETAGLDTNNGLSPLTPFATITNAINNASEGDAITIKAGDYYETNLNINLIGLELWGEIGVIIYNMIGTGLTISARNCRVNEIIFVTPGQTAVELSGNYCVLSNITAATPAIGLDISGQGNRIDNYIVGAPTTTGIDISGPYNTFREVFASNDDVAARGFYLSAATAILNIFESCHSIGNTIAGFETVLGADHNSFLDCSSGGGDGKRLDLGYHNLWVIEEQLTTEHNEQLYPMSDGEGTAGLPITVDNTATDDTPDTRSDQNYWGDTVAIILPDVLTTFWNSIGIFIFATTANKICQWQIWFPNAKYTTTRNGGLAWNLGQTIITVADASQFLVNDLIWMRSNGDPNGEILEITNIAGNVITVASETRFSGNTGIRYNHVGGEAIYIIGRATDDQFTSIEGGYSAGSGKDSYRYLWHHIKELPGDSAMIIRMLNTLDNLDVTFDVAALYEM